VKLDQAIKDLQKEKLELEGKLKSVTVAIGLLTKLNTNSEPTAAAPPAKPPESSAAGAKSPAALLAK
jgi:hypothetical protein